MSDNPNPWAVGYTAFAAIMLMLMGLYQVMVGLVAIIEDDIYAATDDYLFRFDVTAWGWIHLALGVIVFLAGFGLFKGSTLGRVIGVIVAMANGLAAFAWVPYYPFWALVLVALSVAVIWSLVVHGGDLAEEISDTF